MACNKYLEQMNKGMIEFVIFSAILLVII